MPNVYAGACGWELTVPQVLVYEAGDGAMNRQLLLFLAVGKGVVMWVWCSVVGVVGVWWGWFASVHI